MTGVHESILWIGGVLLASVGAWFRNFLSVLVPSPQRTVWALKNLLFARPTVQDRVRVVLGWLDNDYWGSNKTAVSTTFAEIEGIELRAIQAEPDSDEREAVKNFVARRESDSEASNALEDARAASNSQVPAHYSTLSGREIKASVVGNKWLAHIRAAIEDDVRHLTQRLLGRVRETVDRRRRPRSDLDVSADSRTDPALGSASRRPLSGCTELAVRLVHCRV